jgi:hypothetical protein
MFSNNLFYRISESKMNLEQLDLFHSYPGIGSDPKSKIRTSFLPSRFGFLASSELIICGSIHPNII